MKLVDANVLIYAVNSDAPLHQAARQWLEKPLSADAAVAFVDGWLQQPPVELVVPGPDHWNILRTLIAAAGTAGNLTSDAHLAAHAIEGDWTLVTTDHDFRRFSGLKVFNPALT